MNKFGLAAFSLMISLFSAIGSPTLSIASALDGCCAPGAACCVPGAACCKGHKH